MSSAADCVLGHSGDQWGVVVDPEHRGIDIRRAVADILMCGREEVSLQALGERTQEDEG